MKRLNVALLSAIITAASGGVASAQPAEPGGPTLTLSGQLRFRGEVLHELDFTDAVDNPVLDDERIFSRARLRVDASPRNDVDVVLELQDSRTFGSEPTSASNQPSLGLHQGYLQLHRVGGSIVDLYVGRQELSYGDQRLIGAFDWSNTGRSFDAVRARIAPDGGLVLDLFGARLHDDRTGIRTLGDDFAGAYLMWDGASIDVDGYALYLHDRGGQIDTDDDGVPDTERFPGGGRYHLGTVGGRFDGQLGGVQLNAEGAVQVGERGDWSIFAAAAHGRVGYAIAAPLAPTLFAGGAYATGDSDPTDDSFGTFENLFPTNHLHYGYADIAAWKNLIEGYGKVQLAPFAGWTVTVAAHALARATTDDLFYRASGAPIGLGVTSTESYVGTDLDLLAKWKAPNGILVLGGLSYVVPGPYLDDVAGGDATAPLFGYLQMQGSF
jgi:hypothetical protein